MRSKAHKLGTKTGTPMIIMVNKRGKLTKRKNCKNCKNYIYKDWCKYYNMELTADHSRYCKQYNAIKAKKKNDNNSKRNVINCNNCLHYILDNTCEMKRKTPQKHCNYFKMKSQQVKTMKEVLASINEHIAKKQSLELKKLKNHLNKHNAATRTSKNNSEPQAFNKATDKEQKIKEKQIREKRIQAINQPDWAVNKKDFKNYIRISRSIKDEYF